MLRKGHLRVSGFILIIVAAVILGTGPAYSISCIDLADLPLEIAQIMGPPGMIMFIFDNSQSMNYEFLTTNQEGSGTLADDDAEGIVLKNVKIKQPFGYEYIFKTATVGGVDIILEEDSPAEDALLWQARYFGYNKIYYNPSLDYQPWPRWTDVATAGDNSTPVPPSSAPSGDPANADPDFPRIQPMDDKYTYDLTATMASIGLKGEIVDDGDPEFSKSASPAGSWGPWVELNDYVGPNGTASCTSVYTSGYCQSGETENQYVATWDFSNKIDTSKQYDVYARWSNHDDQSTAVNYMVYHDGGTVISTVDQSVDSSGTGGWQNIASSLSFISEPAKVQLVHKITCPSSGAVEAAADAVKFVAVNAVDIKQRHYYVKNTTGVFLVNLDDIDSDNYPDYYEFIDDGDNFLEDGEIRPLSLAQADAYGIFTGRTFTEEKQNYANWFSFYRKRDYTARNALGQVVTQMSNILFGLSTIPERVDIGVRWIDVDFNKQYYDNTPEILNLIYMLPSPGGDTTLRKGMNKVGKYFQELGGTMACTADKNALGIYTDSGTTYPYFTKEWGGECQQAYTIMMTDGSYNGTGPNIPNADGDNNSEFDGGKFADIYQDTLADGAMEFYETDLKDDLILQNYVPTNDADDNKQQHLVTYALTYGAYGTINPEDWPDCQSLDCTDSSCCPDWPEPVAGGPTTLDDLYHASVNGRGLFLNASNPPELLDALLRIKEDIETREGSSAAVSTNSVQRQVGAQIYQGLYFSGSWWGNLKALSINPSNGEIMGTDWEAREKFEDSGSAWYNRVIITAGTADGIPFQGGQLTTDQINTLQSGLISIFGDPPPVTVGEFVEYLRGNDAYEQKNGGPLRSREGKLGDIVHSEPFYHEGVVYVGANDGMLHAFDSSDGQELFAYVPGMVYENLTLLADPLYKHKFFVDANPYARQISSTQSLLAGGLGKGGKGVYCLDITDAAIATETNAAGMFNWEYHAASDADLGYLYGQAYIANTNDGWKVIFGNGYDSDSGEAVLYLIDAVNGPGGGVTKLKTGIAGCNGMSSPALIDVEFDGIIDYIYVGDLMGNLWKFDLTKSTWTSAYTDGTSPKPLFTARNKNGEIQPITSEPDVMPHCLSTKGYIVIFGTGQYLNDTDLADHTIQSMYGVWDWQDELVAQGIANPEQKYLGTLSADTLRILTNLNGDSILNGNVPTLLEQTVENNTADWIILTQNPIIYFPNSVTDVTHLGWYYDLPEAGERVFEDPLIRKGVAVFVSTAPDPNPCSRGGSSVLYQVDACSGGRTVDSQFDVDHDNDIDSDDTITVGDVTKIVTGKKISATIYSPVELSTQLYVNDATGDIFNELIPPNPSGMIYWRLIQ